MPNDFPDSRYRTFRLVSALVLAVFTVVYGFQCVKNGRVDESKIDVIVAKKEKLGNDFTAFYSAGEQARLGKNIYAWQGTSVAHRPFEYPPLFAVFPMLLLSYFKFNTALAIFYAMNAALLITSFFLLRRTLWPPLESCGRSAWQWPLVGMLITLVISWRYIHSNTNESNANLFILFLLTLAFYFDRSPSTNNATTASNSNISETPQSGLLAGVAVAMATAVKLTPGLFGVYFLWSRRRWSMLGGAMGLVLFLLIVPGTVLGWNQNLKYLDAFKTFALGKTTGSDATAPNDPDRIWIGRPHQLDPNESASPAGVGVSLKGTLTNLLTPSPALKKDGDKPRTVNIATLEPKQVSTIANSLSLILLLATVVLTFSDRARSSTHAAALSWSLVVVAMTLMSPMTRIAHLVVLAIPIATLVSMLQQKMLTGIATKWVPAALIIVLLSGAAPEYVRAMGAMTFSMLILYAALAIALRDVTSKTEKSPTGYLSPSK